MKSILKFVLIYLTAAILWLILTNFLIVHFFTDRFGLIVMEPMVQGIFILLSAGFLLILLKNYIPEKFKAERRCFELLETTLAGIIIYQNGRVLYQNEHYRHLFLEEGQTEPAGDLRNIHPDDHGSARKEFNKLITGETDLLDLEIRINPETRIPSLKSVKWCYCRGRAVHHQGHRAVILIIVDITRQKELEFISRINNKMSSLGRVSAGIAHEIRNPLSGLNIYLTHLERLELSTADPEENDRLATIITNLKKASNSISTIVNRVMDFSKPGQLILKDSNINIPVEDAINLTAVTLRKEGVLLAKELDPAPAACRINANMIGEVVVNLIRNAVDAMKSQDSEQRILIKTFHDADHQYLSVSDSGPGIGDLEKEKIFDPFYTTKENSTGIGLSLCHRIITDHGGQMEIRDYEEPGAEFIIKLPIRIEETP